MPIIQLHSLFQYCSRREVKAFLWRLLLPLVLLLALPHAENMLQDVFMAEGILRVGCNIWSFRGPALLAFRYKGICVLGFLLEESLQELILILLSL